VITLPPVSTSSTLKRVAATPPPHKCSQRVNGHSILNSSPSWGGGGGGGVGGFNVPFVPLLATCGEGRGRGEGRELMKHDLSYILPQLKGTLYKFRIEHFGDIHCKITIKLREDVRQVMLH
jgi:hypothetical protein